MFNSQTGFVSNFVEQDGCARTVIVLLLLTTVGCVSYTWGYYEGIANAQSNLMLDKLHEMQLLQMSVANNGTEARKHVSGHGMRLAEAQPGKQQGKGEASGKPAAEEVDKAATHAAAALEEAATGSLGRKASDHAAAQLRGSSSAKEGDSSAVKRRQARRAKSGRHEEE
ncbi:hypothetical protein Vretifemale_1092 [Volvox reticuliferus]|uniref:Uncharacterized protein n=1 Tax=Volvox reticuliferus TaxID=1737510 RepID=A0A8J4BX49_9CHLO|nr:hypothetical protein Vretifemale_1092 [Volvox reticuliferus]